MNTLKLAFKVSRYRFWAYTAGTFLVGFTIGAKQLADFNTFFFISLIYFLFIGNALLYGINDYFDYDTDKLNRKKRTKEHLAENKERKQLRNIVIITLILSLIFVAFQKNTTQTLLLLLFVFLSVFYSTPPLRFKAKPIIDFVSNILYIMPGIYAYNLATGKLPGLIITLGLFTWAMAMHLFSAIPDIVPDKKAKLKTTAVVFGKHKSLVLCTILWTIFSASLLTTTLPTIFKILAFIYPFIPLYLLISKKNIVKAYWYYPYINTLAGFAAFVIYFIKIL